MRHTGRMQKSEIDATALRERVGEVLYERGRRYAAEGRVHLRRHDGSGAEAEVDGSETYEVEVEAAERGVAGSCSCPFAEEGFFCKHMVAVVLCWLEEDSEACPDSEAGPAPGAGPDSDAGPRLVPSAGAATPSGGVVGAVIPGPGQRPEDLSEGPDEPHADTSEEQRLRTFLSKQETGWLVEMLLEAGRRDPMFAARLAVQAGVSGTSALDEAPLRTALVDAIPIEDFVGYREAWDYFWGIDQVLEEVEELIEAGFAPSAARTALFAIELLEEFGGQVDDSDGGLMLAFERAEDIHLRASQNQEIDPEELASMLVDRALGSDYEIFYDAPARYAEILGERGLRRYRELVEERWRALPEGRDRFDGDRFAVGFLRERAAETAGGGQALLEVLAEDASSAYDYLRIAQLLYREERMKEALDWIESGLETDGPDRRLNELAATIHREAGRVDRAGELLWENFTAQPGTFTYRELRSGTGEAFARWREQAIALLKQPRGRGADWTALVSSLLWEGDIERAWDAAHEGGCRQDLWLELARGRARDHPAEALPIFLQEADRSIEGAQRPAYRHAAALLAEARPLAERTDGVEAFTSHVRRVRERNKRRPALQDEFTRARLP